jgi:hypothetical protein
MLPKLYSISELARKLGVERRALKKARRAKPVAVAALGKFNVELYRLHDFEQSAAQTNN